MQHKHPKNGRPLLRIQPLQKELAKAISYDVCRAQVSPNAVGEKRESASMTVGEGEPHSACAERAVVGPIRLPLVGDEPVEEPDPDMYGSGFGWDDPDDF